MKNLNLKFLPGVLMVGALLASGTASAVNCGSVSLNPNCTDSDGDVTVSIKALTGNFPAKTTYDLTEITVGNKEIYEVGFNWDAQSGFPNGYTPAPGDIHYTITSNPLPFSGVNLDTSVYVPAGGATGATKNVYDASSLSLLATQHSLNGGRDPNIGETAIVPTNSLMVVDTFTQNGGGVFLHADNSFTTAVPEPGEFALMLSGLGLFGFLAARRRG